MHEGSSRSLNDVYRLRIEACLLLDRPEKAKKTAVAGTEHFQEVGRFDGSVAWLYDYCVTHVFGSGQERQALAICEAYRASLKQRQRYYDPWFHLSAKREELLARLAGRPVPDMSGLHLIDGTAQNGVGLRWARMAASEGKLWFTSSQYFNQCEAAMLYEHAANRASRECSEGRESDAWPRRMTPYSRRPRRTT